MPDVNFDDLLSRVRLEVPQCPNELMRQRLVDTARDFCRRTRAWIYEVENETIMQAVNDYDIELPNTQCLPIAIMYLTVDGVQSMFKDVGWLDANIQNWRNRSADDFRYFTQLQPLVFTFPGKPTRNGTPGGMYYRVSLRPKDDATVIDEALADEWIEVWSKGALAELRAITGKPWTDLGRAAMLGQQYRVAREQAKVRIEKSYGNSIQTWANRNFVGK